MANFFSRSKAGGKLLNALLDYGKTHGVNGAGGSINSEIRRQVLKFNPKSLVLVGKGKNRIFHMEKKLQALHLPTSLIACIGDVTNYDRMHQLFEQHRPDVIFHAAAPKYVPLMKSNVGEAVKNNIGGTRCVADHAHECGVKKFVLISTDKTVNSSSFMRAGKHLAERYVHALSQTSSTMFVVVRFGNVLSSAGSVVPIFQEQIRSGGPITVTDARMTRFFMAILEATQFVLQVASMGQGREIFVLAMGKPVKIVDLARDLIRLSGLPENAIEIEFTGTRLGEKLYEELYFADEKNLPTDHEKVRYAYHRPLNFEEVTQSLTELEELVHKFEEVLRLKFGELVPDYRLESYLRGLANSFTDLKEQEAVKEESWH